MIRRARFLSVVAILAGGAVGIVSSTQTWLDVALHDSAFAGLHVPGASAVPLLAPLSLAALALGLALTIVGTALRYAFGVLAVAIGGIIAVGAWRVGAERPVDAVASTVTEATGLAGIDAVTGLVSQIVATPWPFATAGAALLIVAGGALTLATGGRWRSAGRKYRTAPGADDTSRPHDAIDSWDDLSRGDDPTV